MSNNLSQKFTKEYIAQLGLDIKEYYSDENTEKKEKNAFTLGDSIKANRRTKDERRI